MTVKQRTTVSVSTSVLLTIGSLVIVLCVGFVAFFMNWEKANEQFNYRTKTIVQTVSQRLASADAALITLIGLSQATEELNSALLTPISEKLIERFPFITSISYLSLLTPPEIESFLAEMRNNGMPQFQLQPFGSHKADTLPDCFTKKCLITTFIEPLEPKTARQIGMDWWSDQRFRTMIFEAVTTNGPALASSNSAIEFLNPHMMLRPTYFGNVTPRSLAERQEQLSGVFLLTIDYPALLEFKLEPMSELSYSLSIIDSNGEEQNIFNTENTNGSNRSLMLGTLEQSQTFNLGNQNIRLDIIGWPIKDELRPLSVLFSMVVTAVLLYAFSSIWLNRRLAAAERSAAQEQLFQEKDKADVTLQSIGDGVITTDIAFRITYINPVAEILLGRTFSQIKGRFISEIAPFRTKESGQVVENPFTYYMGAQQSRNTPTHLVLAHPSGREISIDCTVSHLTNRVGNTIGSVLVMRDVSLESELTSALAYQASHDALTGLLNRNEFENRLKEMLESSRIQKSQHALCYIDLDQFKLVNDTCGHLAGDNLLKQLASILQAQMREMDVVARLGGDEFGVLIHHCGLDRALEVAERLKQVIGDHRFKWDEKIFDVHASIGVVQITHDIDTLSDLMSAADLACYTAKDMGRDTVHAYQPNDKEIAHRHSQMQWLPRIQEALHNNEFKLVTQRIVSLQNNTDPHEIYEFLLRWPQGDGSQVSPGIFIPAAERYDLMRNIDRWVVQNAFSLIEKVHAEYVPLRSRLYSINLSGQSIGDPKLAGFISSQLKRYNITPELICFEITETSAIANYSTADEFIRQMLTIGCQFALDDFGSGLSSFGYLKQLPVSLLKIDGQFVRDMAKDPVDRVMVRTIQDVARALKLKTIAEWVEDEQVIDLLREIGIDYAQGFHIEKPQPADKLLVLS
ncbi:EAL domain-containing protein [Sedimenticola selenatireducens]|uniref:EAL domain-containing protein n=1 Tax=Sedimenticola selenatireducens TaxID=191960 RepID=A0A558DVT3_9GAMM|nr:EAL domain-containing protein [Sedimenticola selenatireducens]TVO77784.1 EAL domain-containing protein [Sedimenticola selenatireducens]TVT65089.1 MAG: EAL domain-containing protein [Sedimenticola selenatireducens]